MQPVAEFLSLSATSTTQSLRYTVSEIGGLGGPFSQALFINDEGQIVGTSDLPVRGWTAFIWEDGIIQQIGGVAGARRFWPWDFNNRGQVVGRARSNRENRAFLWENGALNDLGNVGERKSQAFAVNEDGVVVGQKRTRRGRLRAFRWTEDTGRMAGLGTLGGRASWANDVNDDGEIVGGSRVERQTHAFIWEDGEMEDLGTLPGGGFSDALYINNEGTVVGVAEDESGNLRSFIWDDDDGMHALDDLGGGVSIVWDINDDDVIVGESSTAQGEMHAFVWRDGQITDLTEIDQSGTGAGKATALNEHGQVVGTNFTLNSNGDVQERPVMWERIHGQWQMFELGPLVADGFSIPRDINDDGLVVGWGFDANSNGRALLWEPIETDNDSRDDDGDNDDDDDDDDDLDDQDDQDDEDDEDDH